MKGLLTELMSTKTVNIWRLLGAVSYVNDLPSIIIVILRAG